MSMSKTFINIYDDDDDERVRIVGTQTVHTSVMPQISKSKKFSGCQARYQSQKNAVVVELDFNGSYKCNFVVALLSCLTV